MRILNVTQTYAPFLEFGGPPVKVRALSEALARRGHQVTVLTADWGMESRFPGAASRVVLAIAVRLAPRENGVQTIYLPTWLHYRALSWNPAAKRFTRARLQNFDVVHIFGLYDLLGPAVAKRAGGAIFLTWSSRSACSFQLSEVFGSSEFIIPFSAGR